MSDTLAFTIQHQVHLMRWDILPCPAIERGLLIASDGSMPGAPGLIGALGYCHQAAQGKAYTVTVCSRNDVFTYHAEAKSIAPEDRQLIRGG